MKKIYRILIGVFVAEIVFFSFLSESGLKVEFWIGNFIGLFICLLPIEIMLIMMCRDKSFSKRKKILCKAIFLFINICYILSAVVDLFGKINA